MKQLSGMTVLEEQAGTGRPAKKGDRVVYNARIYLNKGEEVPINSTQAAHLPQEVVRVENGVTMIDDRIVLGRRQAIAGIEHALVGMQPGGYRKVRISPHLAYREKGVPGLIPPDAVLTVELWLREIIQEGTVPSHGSS